MARLTINFVQETCKDLLLVVRKTNSDQSWDVEFLRRTVSDFLFDDRVRLVIEQQSPDYFEDAGFLIDLGELRSVCLLSKIWETCGDAEVIFADAITWAQELQPDVTWLSRCETLMINVHRQMQVAGICRIAHHSPSWIQEYINVGLSEYFLVLVVLWHSLAIRPSHSLMLGDPEYDLLERFLWVWLTSIWRARY